MHVLSVTPYGTAALIKALFLALGTYIEHSNDVETKEDLEDVTVILQDLRKEHPKEFEIAVNSLGKFKKDLCARPVQILEIICKLTAEPEFVGHAEANRQS